MRLSFNAGTLYLPWSQIRADHVQNTIVQPLGLFLHRLTASTIGAGWACCDTNILAGAQPHRYFWDEQPQTVWSAGDAVQYSNRMRASPVVPPRGCIGCEN
jgi:hypothetical protein